MYILTYDLDLYHADMIRFDLDGISFKWSDGMHSLKNDNILLISEVNPKPEHHMLIASADDPETVLRNLQRS